MPDWSYRTLFRPLLFKLPAESARDLSLKTFGLLGKLPFGSFIIRTMGHMEMSPVLESELEDVNLKYPVGLSGSLDIHGTAHKALSQIGFGFIEVGPVTLNKGTCRQPIYRDEKKEAIIYPDPYVNDGVDQILQRLKLNEIKLPLMFRLRHSSGSTTQEAFEQICSLSERVSGFAAGYYVDCLDEHWSLEENIKHTSNMAQFFRSLPEGKPVFLYIPLDYPPEKLKTLLQSILVSQLHGFMVGDYVQTDSGYEAGWEDKSESFEKVHCIQQFCEKEQVIIASGGIHEPQDALDLMEAGADYVQLHSGLVYAGPGLPKRVNEAILYERTRNINSGAEPSFWKYWGWMSLLGIGMVIGGILAWIIAATTVLLPYDESFLGISAAQLASIYPQIVAFMSHDRITLAGTMISIGIIYFQLGRYGLRYELHWAKTALMASGIVGFSSFFLYLGYGYFDPLHAVAAAILLPMFIVSMRSRGDQVLNGQPNLVNDRKWLLAQWGQLMFVILGTAFAIGGLTISYIGVTDVFVHEDLGFLNTTPETMGQFNERLLSLIAHDRAGFGGALLSDSIAILATALWGIQQGQRWAWWMFLLGGIPGFLAGFSVHWMIGYTDFIHLLLAYLAFAVYVVGLVLLYPYLMNLQKQAKH